MLSVQDSFHSDFMEKKKKKREETTNRQIKTNLCVSVQTEKQSTNIFIVERTVSRLSPRMTKAKN